MNKPVFSFYIISKHKTTSFWWNSALKITRIYQNLYIGIDFKQCTGCDNEFGGVNLSMMISFPYMKIPIINLRQSWPSYPYSGKHNSNKTASKYWTGPVLHNIATSSLFFSFLVDLSIYSEARPFCLKRSQIVCLNDCVFVSKNTKSTYMASSNWQSAVMSLYVIAVIIHHQTVFMTNVTLYMLNF